MSYPAGLSQSMSDYTQVFVYLQFNLSIRIFYLINLSLELGGKPTDPKEILKQYGTDLTEMAKNSKLDPVIGREEEIRRTLQM